MKARYFSLMAVLLAFGAWSALAADSAETFNNLTATHPDVAPAAGNSTFADFVYTDEYGSATDPSLNVELVTDDATDFENAADDKYLKVTGFVDQWLRLDSTNDTALPGTDGGVVQVALALRVDALAAAGLNTLDVIRVKENTTSGSTGNLFGLVVVNDVFRMGTNGFADVNLINAGNDPFNPSSANHWQGAGWKILAGRLELSASGAGAAKWWVIDRATGAAEELVSATGLTQTAVGGVKHVSFGASYDVAPNTATAVSIDNVTFYDATLIATESAFLAAVKSDYADPSSVADWSLF